MIVGDEDATTGEQLQEVVGGGATPHNAALENSFPTTLEPPPHVPEAIDQSTHVDVPGVVVESDADLSAQAMTLHRRLTAMRPSRQALWHSHMNDGPVEESVDTIITKRLGTISKGRFSTANPTLVFSSPKNVPAWSKTSAMVSSKSLLGVDVDTDGMEREQEESLSDAPRSLEIAAGGLKAEYPQRPGDDGVFDVTTGVQPMLVVSSPARSKTSVMVWSKNLLAGVDADPDAMEREQEESLRDAPRSLEIATGGLKAEYPQRPGDGSVFDVTTGVPKATEEVESTSPKAVLSPKGNELAVPQLFPPRMETQMRSIVVDIDAMEREQEELLSDALRSLENFATGRSDLL